MRNACLDAALAELDAVGIRDYQLARGGKHLQLRWMVAGHALRVLTIPLTPSDWRSPQNTRSDLRKLLRQDGLLEANGAHPPMKPKPDPWRQQLKDLIRRLNQLHVPEQLAAERSEIAAALRKLLDRTINKENGHDKSVLRFLMQRVRVQLAAVEGGGFVVFRRDKHRHRGRYRIGEAATYEEAVVLAQAHHDEQLAAFTQWQEGRHGAF